MTATDQPRQQAAGAGDDAAPRGLVDTVFQRPRARHPGRRWWLLVGVTRLANPRFLSEQGIKDLLLNASILALLAVGQSMVVITRNVDLSVGSVLGLAAFAAGDFLPATTAAPSSRGAPGHRDRRGLRAGQRRCWSASAGCPRSWSRSARCTSSGASTTPGRTAGRSTPPTCPPGFLDLGNGSVLGVPVPAADHRSRCMLAIGYYLRSYPQRPRAVRDRLQPGGRPARRHPGPPADPRRVRLLSGALAGLAGAL